jgi:ribonuclease HII
MASDNAWVAVVPDSPTGEFERLGQLHGFARIAGIDEAGRGPIAGPVVAAAVLFAPGLATEGIRDSKLLSAKQREALIPWIEEKSAGVGLGIVEAEEVDAINIFQATLRAMAIAVTSLKQIPDCLLIDGGHCIPADFLPASVEQRAIEKGDRRCLSIAAASIVAKVARDRMMAEYDERYPGYGFARHKGYATESHVAALRRLGPSPVHRRSFAPVSDWTDGVRNAPVLRP